MCRIIQYVVKRRNTLLLVYYFVVFLYEHFCVKLLF